MIRLRTVTILLVALAGCGGNAGASNPTVHDSLASSAIEASGTAEAFALLVGINTYEPPSAPGEPTRWRDLRGTSNDVAAVSTLLRSRYGFQQSRIRTLQDRQATREAIFGAIREHLLANAAPGVELFFYYSGHGSQIRRTVQGRDEWVQTLVPADSWAGVPDIADLELRRLFNDLLDRGARLSIVIDSCHSGGVTRSGTVSKSLQPSNTLPELPAEPGPLLSSRGAVQVLAALAEEPAQELELAPGEYAGAFTHLFITELMRAGPEVSLAQVVERVGVSLRARRLAQTPLLLASIDEQSPLLASRPGGEGTAPSVRLLRLESGDVDDWRVIGGLDIGLYPRSQLRAEGDDAMRFEIVRSVGLTESIANPLSGQHDTGRSEPEWATVVRFAPAPVPPLLVFLPDEPTNPQFGPVGELLAWTQALEDVALVAEAEVAEAALSSCYDDDGESGLRWTFPSPRGVIGHLNLTALPCRSEQSGKDVATVLQADLRKLLRAVSLEVLAAASELADFPYQLEYEQRGSTGSDAAYALSLRALEPAELEMSLAIAGGGRYFNLWALDSALEIHGICPDPRSTGCAQERIPVGGWRNAPHKISLPRLELPKDERLVIFGLLSTEQLWRGLFGLSPMRASGLRESYLQPHEALYARSPSMRGVGLAWNFQMHVIENTEGELDE